MTGPIIKCPTIKVPQDSNLDILRSVAVLAVFASHLLQVIAGRKLGEFLVYGVPTDFLGSIGVLIFFVHTSLVLMQSIERTRTRVFGAALVRNFYIRRAFRIYPLSIFVILIAVVFSIPENALGATYHWLGMKWFLVNILLIQNLVNGGSISAPLWSLPYEVQMYLILPILFLLVRAPKRGVRLTAIYVASLFLGRLDPLLRFVPCFLAGVIAYRLLETVRPRLPSWSWCPAVLFVVGIYTSQPRSGKSWLKDVLVCLALGALIPLFRKSTGVIATVAAHVAKYSYGIYLCHTPILWLLYLRLAVPDWERPIWLAIAIVAVPVACYHLIEHPLIQIGNRLANRVCGVPAGVTTELDRYRHKAPEPAPGT
jgi:peptidoglycan/LPS O-acetylase OafA/YrhL